MDDQTTRIAIGLRLGTPLCQPHICHCGGYVDALATHGLSCNKSQGRFSRHAAINAIIHRSLAAINVPSTLDIRVSAVALTGFPDTSAQHNGQAICGDRKKSK